VRLENLANSRRNYNYTWSVSKADAIVVVIVDIPLQLKIPSGSLCIDLCESFSWLRTDESVDAVVV
jgi:hypothetical protein